jgi:hypothetical protein
VRGQSGLADPGLAGQQRHPPLAPRDVAHQRGHALGLLLSPDEPARRHLGQPRRKRQQPPLGLALPHHLDGLEGLGQSLEFEGPDRGELVTAPGGEETNELLGQDLATDALVTQPGGLDQRHTKVVALLGGRVA